MNPSELNLWVPSFRGQQWEAIEQAVEAFSSGKRHVAYALQTGSGKSVIGMAVAKILSEGGEIKGKTVVLTPTKGLQGQYLADCAPMGMADIRGKGNYVCAEYEPHSCEEAWPLCGGCKGNMSCAGNAVAYRHAYDKAISGKLVVTNYDYWCRVPTLAESTDLLIMDEVQEAADAVCSSMAVAISDSGMRHICNAPLPWPKKSEEAPGWEHEFAKRTLYIIRSVIEELKRTVSRGGMSAMATGAGSKLAAAQRLETGLANIKADDNWVAWGGETDTGKWRNRWVKFEPVWAGKYTESVLFQGVPRVFWMSGTLKSKTLALNGVKKDGSVEFKEWGPVFKWTQNPIVWVRGGNLKHGAGSEEFEKVCGLAEEMVKTRAVELGRSGLVQTVSYPRTREYVERSKYKELIITHESGGVEEAVERYKEEVRKGKVRVLVSPAIDTGYDFKHELARWQFLMKVPFISTKDPLNAARAKRDKTYPMFVTMSKFAQMCGRICRDELDWGETIVADNNIGWFMDSFKSSLAPVGFEIAGPKAGLPRPVKEVGR